MEEYREFFVSGRGGIAPRVGLFIRAWLMRVGRDYPASIHRAYIEAYTGVTTVKGKPFRLSTYQSFMQYFHRCVRLGLLKFAYEEPSEEWNPEEKVGWKGKPPFPPRRYYELTPKGIERIDLWKNPIRGRLPREVYLEKQKIYRARRKEKRALRAI